MPSSAGLTVNIEGGLSEAPARFFHDSCHAEPIGEPRAHHLDDAAGEASPGEPNSYGQFFAAPIPGLFGGLAAAESQRGWRGDILS
jgi:hypothetical protein